MSAAPRGVACGKRKEQPVLQIIGNSHSVVPDAHPNAQLCLLHPDQDPGSRRIVLHGIIDYIFQSPAKQGSVQITENRLIRNICLRLKSRELNLSPPAGNVLPHGLAYILPAQAHRHLGMIQLAVLMKG